MDKAATIVPIDHGNGNIKTPYCVFPASVDVQDTEPSLAKDVIFYKEKYYVIGEGSTPYNPDKTLSIDYRILTLAAAAHVLLNLREYSSDLILACGLPTMFVGTQKESFRSYLMQDPSPEFTFRGKYYKVNIRDVFLFPQGLAAVLPFIGQMNGQNMIVDIGNGTLSGLFINDRKPAEKGAFTENCGVRQCITGIRDSISRSLNISINHRTVDSFIRNPDDASFPSSYAGPASASAAAYVSSVASMLRDHGFNSDYMHLFVTGGGVSLIRNFGSGCFDFGSTTFIDDICANARGYEALARRRCEKLGIDVYG